VAGVTDLEQLLATLEPQVRDGEYVYVAAPDSSSDSSAVLGAEAVIHEAEDSAMVLRREVADEAGLTYDVVLSWITLTVHSSLEAVGLTAAFSTALGDAGISCNVLAGLHHDHVLVPVGRRDDAVTVLRELSGRHR
jgi:uncharacterized protein